MGQICRTSENLVNTNILSVQYIGFSEDDFGKLQGSEYFGNLCAGCL